MMTKKERVGVYLNFSKPEADVSIQHLSNHGMTIFVQTMQSNSSNAKALRILHRLRQLHLQYLLR